MAKFRAGLQPSQNDELSFKITTGAVEKYLQDRMNAVVRIARERHDKDNDEKNISYPNVNIRVYTPKAGRNFYPFIITLPLDVLVDEEERQKDGFYSIYDTDSDEDGKKQYLIKDAYWKVLEPFQYTKKDASAFTTDVFKRTLGVKHAAAIFIKDIRTPKVLDPTNSGKKVVTMLLDPLKIFHDMVKTDDDRRNYVVDIIRADEVKKGEYVYKIIRRINKKGDKNRGNDKSFIAQINRKMNGY